MYCGHSIKHLEDNVKEEKEQMVSEKNNNRHYENMVKYYKNWKCIMK